MPRPKGDKNVQTKYEWCQYTEDVEGGWFTIRKITTEDHVKVYSQGEAIKYCREHND